jgi:16S rRNA processing protein RimM
MSPGEDPSQSVPLGRLVGAHGLRGEVRVRYFGDGPDNLLALDEVRLTESPEALTATVYKVLGVGSGRKGEIRLALEGVSDRDQAVQLRGLWVMVEADALEPLAEGEYYWHELVGCRVETSDGREVGVVKEILETGAHDVLVVEDATGRSQLIPTAREIMTEVDLEARRVIIDALPGLVDFGDEDE